MKNSFKSKFRSGLFIKSTKRNLKRKKTKRKFHVNRFIISIYLIWIEVYVNRFTCFPINVRIYSYFNQLHFMFIALIHTVECDNSNWICSMKTATYTHNEIARCNFESQVHIFQQRACVGVLPRPLFKWYQSHMCMCVCVTTDIRFVFTSSLE